MADGIKAGTEVNHYRILEKLGAGGMGEVFLAEDTRLDRRVALKILPPEFAEDVDRMNRFVREAKTASALNHPNIITIYEINEFEDTHFIATEFVEGTTLSDYARSEVLSHTASLEIAIQIASALDEAHRAGIVHRDIKPDNVMIRPDGLLKILDFGIAKLIEKKANANSEDATAIQQPSTSPGMIIGTANYMSPEQAKGETVDARSDIFSFGVVLYEMLAGHLPFGGKTPIETIGAIIHKEPLPLGEKVPEEIAEIVNKCLIKEKNERYQATENLLADLKNAQRRLEFSLESKQKTSPFGEEPKTQILKATTIDENRRITDGENQDTSRTIKKSAFKKVLIGALVLLLFSAIGLGYWFYRGNSVRQIESIAVIPFVNESGNQETEYLSDGMTETLIASLSQLPNLSVKARASVFRYKGKETNPQAIGRELNVAAILTGRVAGRGDRLTVSLELIDARTENVIWSERYDRPASALVSLQSEIARDVSAKLKTKLSGADEQKVTKNSTADPEAYQHYLRGRFYWNKRTEDSLNKAIKEFQKAVEKDPNYDLAYVGLADSHVLLEEYARIPASETMPRARAYAERALAINENLAEVHATLGLIKYKSWEWEGAEIEFRRAIELNSNYPTAHHWYSIYLRLMNRQDEAFAESRRALELDPLSMTINANMAQAYLTNGDLESAAEQCRKMIELDPTSFGGYLYMGFVHIKQNRYGDAAAILQKAADLSQRATLDELGYALAMAGKRNEAIAVLKELEKRYEARQTLGMDIAAVYTGLGDKNQAFAWLEKDFAARSSVLPMITISLIFDPLRSDPRYTDLLRRMNLK